MATRTITYTGPLDKLYISGSFFVWSYYNPMSLGPKLGTPPTVQKIDTATGVKIILTFDDETAATEFMARATNALTTSFHASRDESMLDAYCTAHGITTTVA